MAVLVLASPALASALTAELSTARATYALGEPVELSLRIANETDTPIGIHRVTDERTGMLWPEIAKGEGEFRRYIGPQYSVKDVHLPVTPLAPGESLTIPLRVLFNFPSKLPGEIDGFFAFDEPGSYRVRVALVDVLPSQTVHTDTIPVQIVAPRDAGAEVWRLLQTRDAAYFLHTGSPLTAASDVSGLEQILSRYPESAQAGALQRSLESHRRSGARAAAAQSRLVDVAGRPVLVQGESPSARATSSGTADEIASVVQAWNEAYNTCDAAALVQHLDRSHVLRTKWEQGSGDADRAVAKAQIARSCASTGRLSLDVIRIHVAEAEASAEVVVHAQTGDPSKTTRTMKLAREGSAWRITEVGF